MDECQCFVAELKILCWQYIACWVGIVCRISFHAYRWTSGYCVEGAAG